MPPTTIHKFIFAIMYTHQPSPFIKIFYFIMAKIFHKSHIFTYYHLFAIFQNFWHFFNFDFQQKMSACSSFTSSPERSSPSTSQQPYKPMFTKQQEWKNTGTEDYPIPVFYPTMEEFSDFGKYIEHIERQNAHMVAGICKVSGKMTLIKNFKMGVLCNLFVKLKKEITFPD